MIEFIHVSKKYGKKTAVEDLNFFIDRDEFVTLVGPSGSGKSTLIKLLIAEEKPTSGQIVVAGRDITTLTSRELPFFRRKIGVVFQDFKILPHKNVYENIAFALEVSDAEQSVIKLKVPEILQLVNLSDKARSMPNELSGGEKQRVSIARALVHEPKLLIADEPTGNLDPINSWEIIDLLFKINKKGTIVLLATHDKEVVDALKKRVITLREGKIVADQAKGKYIL
ncbi:MAG: cell division ATP-binding protein FtsE [Patescibacteria group bacterium]